MTSPQLAKASSWLLQHRNLLPAGGLVLDVATGRGRHALAAAAAGCRVHAIDRDVGGLAALRAAASVADFSIDCAALDLETDPPPRLGEHRYDAILVFNYLHRPLFPSLIAALAPGGRLFYETFTIAQAARGKPTNPAFLLRPGELRQVVAPLTVLHAREGDFDGRAVASIVAEVSSDK